MSSEWSSADKLDSEVSGGQEPKVEVWEGSPVEAWAKAVALVGGEGLRPADLLKTIEGQEAGVLTDGVSFSIGFVDSALRLSFSKGSKTACVDFDTASRATTITHPLESQVGA
jgi:hypothetical protein